MIEKNQSSPAGSAERSKSSGARCLRLRPAGLGEIRMRTARERSWDLVDRQLRRVMDGLICGRLPWPLYLWGREGVGKTRASLALCDRVHAGRYWTVDGIIREMLAHDPPWLSLWGWPSGPPLAVLDELGLHVARDVEFDAVKQFADWREDRATIYISNLGQADLARAYDRRIASRVCCGTQFELRGRDRRFRGGAE